MNKKVKFISFIAVISCVSMMITSCGKKNPNSPGVEFMPDMYRSPSLKPNMAYVTNNGDSLQVNKTPVSGTIARGHMPYIYPNTLEGYEASANLKNPFQPTEANLKEGEELFSKFCSQCHGAGGEGDGLVAEKLPGPPPPYSTKKTLPDGKMFHSITYGKGLMGSHASQVSPEERWKLVLYIRKLQFPDGMPTTASVDPTVANKK